MLNRAIVWFLAVGLVYGAFQKGAFYAKDFKTVATLVLVAGLVALVGVRARPQPSALLVLSGLGGVILLGAIAATANGGVSEALPLIALAANVACVVYACSALSAPSRLLLAHLLILVGLIVAVTSWVGVAFHRYPWALLSQTLWRGASTLTYANAAAALLFAPMVIAAVAYIQTRRQTYLLVTYALTVGWAATLSRAAGVSLVVAVAIVLLRARNRREVLCLWPLIPGVFIAFVALLPSLPEHERSRPGIAVLGVVVGAVASIGLTKLRARYAVALVVTAAVAIGAVAGTGQAQTAIDRIHSTRVGVHSSDRTDLLKVTWQQLKANPLVGVGPGRINFVYVNHAGEPVRAKYTHNEYLQLAAEIGVGAAPFLLLILIGFVVSLRDRSLDHVGALAVLLGFAIHSALDFLWHIPEVTLLAVATVCVLKAGVEFRPRDLRLPDPERQSSAG